MDEKQKEDLREIIEGQSFGNYQDMIIAKENMDTIAKSVKDLFSMTPAHFKKLVKLNYDKSIEIERRKFAELDDLYIDLFEPAEEKSAFDPEPEQRPYGAIVERFNDQVKSLDDDLLNIETIEKGAK
jgi:hypothetical protein